MANETELMQARKDKLKKIEEYGIHPHPEKYETTNEIGEGRKLEDGTKNVSLAGRVMSKRKMGKISFLDLSDITGHIQLVIKRFRRRRIQKIPRNIRYWRFYRS